MRVRLLVVLALLCAAQVAAAQCARGPQTAAVTLPGFLAVYYQQFRSNAAADTAEFYGGVCVTAVGGEWTVIADRVMVGNLSTDIYIDAEEPTLYLEGWRMSGERLRADVEHLTLTAARFTGPDVSGSAGELDIDLLTNGFTLRDVALAGTAFQVTGTLATLQGTVLRVEGAGVTTCIGLEPPPFAIESSVATVDLSGRAVLLDQGLLRVGNLRIPLREELTLSEATLAGLELPVKVATVLPTVPGPAPVPGEGLSVRVVGIPLTDDVTLELGATGVNTPGATRPVALLGVGESVDKTAAGGPLPTDATATFGLEAGAPYLDVGVVTDLQPWLALSLAARSGAQPARPARHEGRVGLEARAGLPALNGGVVAEAFAAVTALTADAATSQADVAGARLGLRVSGTAATRPLVVGGVPLGTLTFEGRAQVTRYPHVWGAAVTVDSATQWGVRLAPTWRLATGPFTASLTYDARFTNSASPFGSSVDGLTALQRATAAVGLQGALAEDLSGRLSFAATYDAFPTPTVPVGFKRLRAVGGLDLEVEPWTVALTATFEGAGLVSQLPDVLAFAQLDLSATRHGWPVVNGQVPYGSLELGLIAEYDLLPGSEGLDRLELRAGMPLAFQSLELRPFVAVDFAGTLAGGGPTLSGYGLDLTFITCCGSFTVGALNDRGSWGASFAIDLERRPGGSGGAAAATEPAPLQRATGNEAEPGIEPDPDAGIMPDAP